MYPNPTNGDLKVITSTTYTSYDFELFDINGKSILRTILLSGINNLGTITNQPGIYVAKLKIGSDNFTQKLVVQ
jgi:hypothetical protein